MFGLCIAIPETEEIRAHWDHSRANFPSDEIFVIGGDFLKSAADLPVDRPLVVLQPNDAANFRGIINLKDFIHPENAIYLFGPDLKPMSKAFLGGREPEYRVFIPTGTRRDMFSYVAYAVVAWDRKSKQ